MSLLQRPQEARRFRDKGTGRAIKEGPDEWIYEVQAKLVEARQNAKVTGDAASSRRPGGLTGSAAGSTEKG
jgi:hypothetical protein